MSINLGTAVGYLDLNTSKFTMGFKQAITAVKGFKDGTSGVASALKGVSNGMSTIGKDMTLKVTTPIVAAGTAVVKTSASLEQSLSKVRAISGATGDDMVKLKDKAIEMGAKTKFSATEASDAFTYMAMAGWKTNDMLNSIDGIMNLSAADGLDLATTSDIVTDAMTAFGLAADGTTKIVKDGFVKEVSNASHFADVMASASSNANTNVSMLGESFKYVAPVAGSLGYSVEDTAVALGLMANSGIKASQAGAGLRAALTNMVKPTDTMQAVMDRYHLSLTNTDGSMKSLSEVMEMLRTKMGSLSEAEQASAAAALFGKEAMSGMLAIINAAPSDYDKLTKAINNADGTAEDMANTMQDNLNGQVTILKSNIESLAISLGDMIVPFIKDLVAKIQDLILYLNGLSDEQKEQILKIAAIVAAIGPVLMIVSKVISVILTLVTIIGFLANPIGIAVVAIGALVAAFVVLWNKSDSFRNFWINLWDGIKTTTKKVVDAVINFFTKTLPEGFESAKAKIKQFPEKIVEFFKSLPEKIGYIIGQVLGHIVKFAVELPGKARKAGKDFVDALINFFKTVPIKIAIWLAKTIIKVEKFKKEFPEKAKEAAKNFLKNLVDKLKEIPPKMLKIGMNIIDGIIDGMSNAIKNAKQAIKDFAGGITKGFKDALGIHSPSKVMKEQVGVQIANGVIEGIKSKKGAAKKSAAKLSEEIIDAATKKLDVLQTYNKITTAQEVDFWKKIYNATKKGTEAHLTAYKNYKSAQQSLNQEILSDAERRLDKLQTYNKISASEEVAYWKIVMNQLKKGSDEYLTAYKNYISAKKSYNEELNSLETEYKDKVTTVYDNLKTKVDELTKAYNDQVESRKNALLSTFSLFKEYEISSDKNGEDLTNSLQSQVNALQKFNNQMSELEGRDILPQDLIDELRNQGVAATGELEALNALTDEKLQQYADLWKQRNQLAQEEAERENKDAYDKLQSDIEKANNKALKKLDNLNTKYQKKLEKIRKNAYSAANSVGKKTGQGIIDGISSKSAEIDTALSSIQTKIQGYMASISASLAKAQASAATIEGLSKTSSSKVSHSKKSHRQGISYVPYDGYNAILHEGEQVLTKEEAKNRSSGDTFIFNSPKAIDEKEAAREMKRAKQQLALSY